MGQNGHVYNSYSNNPWIGLIIYRDPHKTGPVEGHVLLGLVKYLDPSHNRAIRVMNGNLMLPA